MTDTSNTGPLAGKTILFTGIFALNPQHRAEQLGATLATSGLHPVPKTPS
jgi:hypothetical protein